MPDYLIVAPIDPFDGKPLRYKKLAKGYVVYSIGTNETDNGGSETIGETGPLDVTFTVKR